MIDLRLRTTTTRCAVASMALAGLLGVSACGGGGGEGTGTDAAAPKSTVVKGSVGIASEVARFRRLLGPDNGGAPGRRATGRRELTWDKVPDQMASPRPLPADFFNARTAPRARGAVLATPGTHVAVSADSDNPAGAAPRFGHINRGYSRQFKTFSRERLFSPIGSNLVDLTFRVPGTDDPAVTRGFGAVYTDIDKVENTAFEYFDVDNRSLGKFAAPTAPEGLSFLGVVFPEPIVARVRIEYGSGKLGPRETPDYDVAVMDDFIYGEPQPAPAKR
jgi:hypothetical protein